MKKKILLCSILFSSIFLSNPVKAELLNESSILVDNKNRTYLVNLPTNFAPNKKYPLLFAFHGGGGNMYHMSTKYGIVEKSNELGFIAVFPNGFSRNRNDTLGTWNAGNCCGIARNSNVDDIQFVRDLVETMKIKFPIDSNKIYATGMSNGAMLSYRLACEMSDTFKAIAAVAGTDNTAFCEPNKLPHILHIHARNDENVPIQGGMGDRSFKKHVTEFTSLNSTINKWLSFSDFKYKKETILQNSEVTCEKYITIKKQHIQVCITEDGAHSWPGAKERRGTRLIGRDKPTTSTSINANDEMWKFFNSVN